MTSTRLFRNSVGADRRASRWPAFCTDPAVPQRSVRTRPPPSRLSKIPSTQPANIRHPRNPPAVDPQEYGTRQGLHSSTAHRRTAALRASSRPLPPSPTTTQPPAPGDGYIWTPGYWAWTADGYQWVQGAWVLAPYTGALWTPGYWGYGYGGYFWNAGYWGPDVGYYGGINYGFGYFGIGFYGGYWGGGRFYYNRAYCNFGAAGTAATTITAPTTDTPVTPAASASPDVNSVAYHGGGIHGYRGSSINGRSFAQTNAGRTLPRASGTTACVPPPLAAITPIAESAHYNGGTTQLQRKCGPDLNGGTSMQAAPIPAGTRELQRQCGTRLYRQAPPTTTPMQHAPQRRQCLWRRSRSYSSRLQFKATATTPALLTLPTLVEDTLAETMAAVPTAVAATRRRRVASRRRRRWLPRRRRWRRRSHGGGGGGHR